MADNSYIQSQNAGRRYEAVLRLSEALSACVEPEDLTKILSEQLRDFIAFLRFYIVVYKENSTDVEWAVIGREKSLVAVYTDVPVEQRPSWQAYTTQEPFHIRDWSADDRVPERLKQGIAAQGLEFGPLVFVPLTTPHRRLGALGMSGPPGTVYACDDISFLRLIGRVVAFAIDDNFNLRRVQAVQRELLLQNERLQLTERELREVIETMPAMAWSAAPDGAAEFFNGRWLAYGGLTLDQAQGWGWTVAVHPDDLPTLVDYWRAVLASGKSGEIEGRLRRFDGVYRWFLFRATPSLDDNGKIVKWYGTNIDIEERKTAEAALKRSEAYLAEAQRLTHTGSCAVDGTSREIVYWSEEMFRLFGFDPREGLPRWDEWVERIHQEDREKFRMAGDRTFLEKLHCDVEFRILKPGGTVKHIHGIGHPVLSPTGELLQVVGTMVDITEQQVAEETFRHIVVGTAATTGSDFFQSLVRHLAAALRARYVFIAACDDHKHASTLAFWKGDGFSEDFGFDAADTPCEKVLLGEVCHYREGLRTLFPLDKVLADWQAESYLGVPMLDRDNCVIGHIAILDDKPMDTDSRAVDLVAIFASRAAAELKRQRAEDKLQAALHEVHRLQKQYRSNVIGELTASLAHEIKQPIGAAVTNSAACVRLLDRDQPDIAEACQAALEMAKDIKRAADIIDRIRLLYRKSSSQPDLVDINEVIREMVVMLENEAHQHSVTINTYLGSGLPQVMADRVQLQQVLMNLMLNGIEAMWDGNGELSIRSGLAEDCQLLISVADTGVGLPTEDTDKMFDAFFTTKSQGTGLGLAISRSIVSSHGGRIWATPNPGRGATLNFTLPRPRYERLDQVEEGSELAL